MSGGAITFHEQADDGTYGLTISEHGRDVLITMISEGENVAAFAVSPALAAAISDAVYLTAQSVDSRTAATEEP
jgi:hypothetical protein